MIIGVDIDGVVADSIASWLCHMNDYFGKSITLDKVNVYQFEKVYEVTWAEMDYFFRTQQQMLISNLAPIRDAKRVLDALCVKGHEIIMITARPEEYRHLTQEWLEEHSIPYRSLLMTSYCDKAEHCKKAGLQTYIEDTKENACSIAKTGIPVILFDAPYNQGLVGKNILRRYTWPDIYRTLQALEYLQLLDK